MLMLAAVVVAVFATPPAAAAAADGIQLSTDGVSYSSALAHPLFTAVPVLVPTDEASAGFWVRNAGPTTAYLTLTLDNPSWTNDALAGALTLGARTPGNNGRTVRLVDAGACSVLLEGLALAAGQAVNVTTTLALGDLTGSAGQGATAAMDIGVTLVEAASLPPSASCATPPTSVVVVVPAVPRGTAPAVIEPGTGETGGGADAPEKPTEPTEPTDLFGIVLANTLAYFDSGIVALAAAAVPLGAGAFLLLGWLRRRRGDDMWEEELP